MAKHKKVSIGLINPKSPTNVGAVMRAAGCYGVDDVYYTGTRFDKARKFHTDTKNITDTIPLVGVENLKLVLTPNCKVVAVELIEGATSLPQFRHPSEAFYIFGPEDGSLNKEVLAWCDEVVYIPTKGCMNLAATVNVLLYDRLAKSDDIVEGDELIRQSRDANNKIVLSEIKKLSK